MYNRKINLCIVSKTADLETILVNAKLSDDALLSFTTVNAFSLIDSNSVDILIDDLSTDFLDAIQTNGSLYVCCLSQSQLPSLTQTFADNAADIWLRPFDANLIQFQFQKLIDRVILQRKYRLHQIYLDSVIDNVPDLIWFKALNGVHLKVNKEFSYTVGKPKSDIEGYDHYHIWGIDKAEYENSDYVCLDTDSIIIQSKKTGVFDEKVLGQRGMRQLKTYKSPILDDCGELVGTVGVAHDVTELKNMDTELELILNTMPYAIMVKDSNQCVRNVNQKFEDFFTVNKAAIIGKPYCIHETTLTNDANPPNLLVYEHDKEIRLQHSQSEMILKIHQEPITDFFNTRIGTLHIFRDVTVERNLEDQLKQLAYTDQLTGLYTRRYLYEYIDENTTVSHINLLYIDLDNFKLINDTYGHHYGDDLLKNIGTVLQEVFPQDTCVRMGGDEFLIVIIGKSSIASLEEKAKTLFKTIKTRFSRFPATQQLSVSLGIATFEVEEGSPIQLDELLKKSDLALYKAKNNGKKQYVVYTPTLENE